MLQVVLVPRPYNTNPKDHPCTLFQEMGLGKDRSDECQCRMADNFIGSLSREATNAMLRMIRNCTIADGKEPVALCAAQRLAHVGPSRLVAYRLHVAIQLQELI